MHPGNLRPLGNPRNTFTQGGVICVCCAKWWFIVICLICGLKRPNLIFVWLVPECYWMNLLCEITMSVNLWYFTSEINNTFLRQSPSTVKAVMLLSDEAWRGLGEWASLDRCDHDVSPNWTKHTLEFAVNFKCPFRKMTYFFPSIFPSPFLILCGKSTSLWVVSGCQKLLFRKNKANPPISSTVTCTLLESPWIWCQLIGCKRCCMTPKYFVLGGRQTCQCYF